MPAVAYSTIPELGEPRRGKVRDLYAVPGKGAYLMVSTDRISTYDVVHPTAIPGKGMVLNNLSAFWLRFATKECGMPTHFITSNLAEIADITGIDLRKRDGMFEGRAMLVETAAPCPAECIVRGYLVGSGWKDYKSTGLVCGIKLPEGLRETAKLEPPLFTPSTKATIGHDENIDFDRFSGLVGADSAEMLRAMSIQLYRAAREYALCRGIAVIDTKFEFGSSDDRELLLIDEALTPDSSRFAPADAIEEGKPPPSMDKQFVRDYVTGIGWDKKPPAPALPQAIVEGTQQRYFDIYERLTGQDPRALFTL